MRFQNSRSRCDGAVDVTVDIKPNRAPIFTSMATASSWEAPGHEYQNPGVEILLSRISPRWLLNCGEL